MIAKIISSFILLFFSVLCCAENIELTADKQIEYSTDQTELVAKGNARVEINDFVMQANEIAYNKETGKTTATGDIKISKRSVFAVCDKIEHSSTENIGVAQNCNAHVGPLFIECDNFSFLEGKQIANNAIVYFGEPETYTANIKSKNVKIINGEKIIADRATFRIGHVPVFYWPRISSPLAEPPIVTFIEDGYNRNFGGYVRSTTYVRTSDTTKAGILFDVYTERGILFGPAAKYSKSSVDGNIKIDGMAGFINDLGTKKERGHDINQNQVQKKRFLGELTYQQHYKDKIDVTGRATIIKDSEVMRDFRPDIYNKNQRPSSHVEVAYRGENYIASAFTRFQLNNFYRKNNRLPEVRLDYLPTEIADSGIYHNGFTSISYMDAKANIGILKNKTTRLDTFYQIAKPFYGSNKFALKPLAGIRVTEYSTSLRDGKNSNNNFTRFAGQIGFDLDTKFYGVYGYKNDLWGIDNIKHIIIPSIQYRYMPKADAGYNIIEPIDYHVWQTDIPTIDLGGMRNIDELETQNMFRVGISNIFQTKTPGYVQRTLMQFDIFQDILLEHHDNKLTETHEKTLHETHIINKFSPIHWLIFESYTKLQTSSMTLKEMTTKTTFNSGDVWKINFSTNTQQHYTNQFSLGFETKLNSQITFLADFRYDNRLKNITEQEYVLKTVLKQAWNIDYYVIIRNYATRESKYQTGIRINLADF